MSESAQPSIRLSDYIMRTLADAGVRHIFLVTGGGAMHLNDAIAREPRIRYVCNHHEQASAIAAEGYARTSDKIGVVNVTAGPGAINALNGVFGAFTDSVPMLVVSGQAKRETCMASYDLPGLRQLGDQEADILAMVKPITSLCSPIARAGHRRRIPTAAAGPGPASPAPAGPRSASWARPGCRGSQGLPGRRTPARPCGPGDARHHWAARRMTRVWRGRAR